MPSIDKGVPIPPAMGLRSRPPKYPIHDMQIGDSFFLPGLSALNVGLFHRQTGFHFTSRQAIEHGVSGRRVWRVAGSKE